MIEGFFVDGTLYRSAGVELEISPFRTNELNFNPELFIIKDTVFLQIIVEGDKGLAYLKPSSGKPQFYISQNGGYELLIFKKYYSTNQNASATASRVISYNKKYIGQLTLFLTNCPGITEKLYAVDYNWRDLQKLFVHYYDCTGREVMYQKEQKKATVEWSVLAGPSITFLDFTTSLDGEFEVITGAEFKPSVFFAAGAGVDLVFPGSHGKWSFNNELMMTSYKSSYQYTVFINTNYYSVYDIEIGATYLQLNTMGRFKYPVGNSYLFINAGLVFAEAIAIRNYEKVEKHFYSSEVYIDEGKVLDDVRSYEFGFLAGLGFRHKHFTGEFRYELSNGMSAYTGLVSPVNRGFFLVGYRF
jgi:hypothetical protein